MSTASVIAVEPGVIGKEDLRIDDEPKSDADKPADSGGLLSVLRKRKQQARSVDVRFSMSKKSLEALDELKTKVDPSTRKETVMQSLLVFDEMIDLYEQGYSFYLKKPDEEMVKWSVFEGDSDLS